MYFSTINYTIAQDSLYRLDVNCMIVDAEIIFGELRPDSFQQKFFGNQGEYLRNWVKNRPSQKVSDTTRAQICLMNTDSMIIYIATLDSLYLTQCLGRSTLHDMSRFAGICHDYFLVILDPQYGIWNTTCIHEAAHQVYERLDGSMFDVIDSLALSYAETFEARGLEEVEYRYLRNKTEVFARMMQVRFSLNLDPLRKNYTSKELRLLVEAKIGGHIETIMMRENNGEFVNDILSPITELNYIFSKTGRIGGCIKTLYDLEAITKLLNTTF